MSKQRNVIQDNHEAYWSTKYYNDLPDYVFGDKILEIGARDGTPQLESRHKTKFLSEGYLGIDVVEWGNKRLLNIQNSDVFDLKFEPNTFDLIFSIHVLEHISFERWRILFSSCRRWTKPSGYIVIIVPDNQLLGKYVFNQDYQTGIDQIELIGSDINIHKVFSITPPVFKYFLPKCKVFRKKIRIKFREPYEGFWRPLGRFFKRLFTFHPYVWHGILRKRDYLLVIWQKPEKEWKLLST